MFDPKRNNADFLRLLGDSEHHPGGDAIEPLLKKNGGCNVAFLEDLIANTRVPKEKVCRLYGEALGFAYIDPLVAIVTRDAVEVIPAEISRKAGVIGLYMINGVLTIAMGDPRDSELIRRLESITQKKISAVFSLPCEIQAAIEMHATSEEEIGETIQLFEKNQKHLLEGLSDAELSSLGENNTLSKILDALLLFAIRERASDIHVEPLEDRARVRLRIDGKLVTTFRFSNPICRAFTARLKVLCKLNIAESRFPQDGRFSIPFGAGKADFRVNFLPTIWGNKIVLRILAGAGKKSLISLDKMLISQDILKPLKRLVRSPNGIFFVTGPTGSGKTTTLYACLQELNSVDKNISTIEDPVEIQVEGLTQTQTNTHIGLSFPLVLRALLRQDPDIILIGEIRDAETAKIACEAALTGHLVLSTLHTNTALQAILRLIEIGIEPYLVAPSIIGVLAQRLAARICEKCKESYFPTPEILDQYFTDIEGLEVPFYRGHGCSSCRQSGYSGRVAFHEMVTMTDEMRTLISNNAGTTELSNAARKMGYRPLRYDGLKKVLLGLTTIDEVERHSVIEWSA